MRYIIPALLSAALLSISWPTYGIPFFIFIALVPLLLLEHEIALFSKIKYKGWAIFGLSYLTFLIWNMVTTGWLYGSRNPDGSHALLAVILPVVTNSLLYAALFWAYHRYKKWQGTYWGLAFFLAIWMSFEKLHLAWDLSWPWLNLGNVFSEYPQVIQWYDTLGATGGTFWILCINLLIFYTYRIWQAERKRAELVKNLAGTAALIVLPMLASLYTYSNYNPTPTGEVSALLLQPDLNPYTEKYSKDSLTITRELLQIAEKNTAGKIDFYIAPETAVPGFGSISETGLKNSMILGEINTFLTQHPGSVFITGASTHRNISGGPVPAGARKYDDANIWREDYNTALQVGPGQQTQTYHKGKLVPGVEIIPFISVVKPLLGNAMLNLGGTVASLGVDTERRIFTNPNNGGKAAPIICYESIYGEFVGDYVRKGANFFAIVTNDSWWGVTEGHRQLLSYARLRAVEHRREIARAANSGISAHINARGDVEESTLYGDQTALFTKIKLYETQSTYSRVGDVLSRFCIFALGFLLCYPLLKKFQYKK